MANVNHYYNFGNCGIPAAPAPDPVVLDPNAWMWGAPAPEAPAAGPPPPPPPAPAAAAPSPQWAAILGNGNPPVAAAAAPAPPPAPVMQQLNAPPLPPPAPAMQVMQPQGAAQWAAIQGPGDAAPLAGPDWFISPVQGGFQAPVPVAAAQNNAGFYM